MCGKGVVGCRNDMLTLLMLGSLHFRRHRYTRYCQNSQHQRVQQFAFSEAKPRLARFSFAETCFVHSHHDSLSCLELRTAKRYTHNSSSRMHAKPNWFFITTCCNATPASSEQGGACSWCTSEHRCTHQVRQHSG